MVTLQLHERFGGLKLKDEKGHRTAMWEHTRLLPRKNTSLNNDLEHSASDRATQDKRKMWPLLTLLLVLGLACFPTQANGLSANGSLNGNDYTNLTTANSGFHPDINGFNFENYGGGFPAINLTPIEMQRMFGDRVIESKTVDDKIILTHPARRWMDEANKAIEGGHCEGMAVLSALIYYNKTSPIRFGGSVAGDLHIEDDLLQREIAYWWATQVTTPGGSIRVNDSPNAVFDTLAETFKEGLKAKEWWVMGLYLPDGSGGHSVTPYAVEDMGNGTAKIWIYDNNIPKAKRAIEIDRRANTWKYLASISPDEPSELYVGNASTRSLEIVSTSSRLGLQNCDFCNRGNSSSINVTKGALLSLNRSQIWLDGIKYILVNDSYGRRFGFLSSGDFVNEIPGAEKIDLMFQMTGNIDHRAVYIVPANQDISIQVVGTTQQPVSLIILSKWNWDPVENSPSCMPGFTIGQPHYISYIDTYHWNNKKGTSAGGTISLRSNDGRLYGPWNVENKPGPDGTPNALWICHPNTIIPAGTYTVIDSDPDSWSQNSRSNHCGFCKVEGYPTDRELWIFGPGYDLGVLNPNDNDLIHLAFTSDGIKVTITGANDGAILGLGNIERFVGNAQRTLEMDWSGNLGSNPENTKQPGCAECENEGVCTGPDSCACPYGYTGKYCEEPVCMLSCAHGTCIGPDKCRCDQGWSGPDCSTPISSGTPSSACPKGTKECNGACIDSSACCGGCPEGQTCDSGQCVTPPLTCPNGCSDHGICVEGGCDCGSGWSGTDCSTPVCTPSCENGGTCVGPDQCDCTSGWTGPGCSYCLSNVACHGICCPEGSFCGEIGCTGPPT